MGIHTFRQILAAFLCAMSHCTMASLMCFLRTTSVHIASFFAEMGMSLRTALAVAGSLSLVGVLGTGLCLPAVGLLAGAGVCSKGLISAASPSDTSAVANPLQPCAEGQP